MIAVIFEAWPHPGQMERYLSYAADLRPSVEVLDGFVSIERFQSLSNPSKLLSLSFFRDEDAVARWRTFEPHREVQRAGQLAIFADYRLRVACVLRDYGPSRREQAPR